MLWSLLWSAQCASDSSSYRMKTPKRMIIAICHTKHTAGRLTRTLVFFWGPKKPSQQFPMLMAVSPAPVALVFLLKKSLLLCFKQWFVFCIYRYVHLFGVWSNPPLRSKVWAHPAYWTVSHSSPAVTGIISYTFNRQQEIKQSLHTLSVWVKSCGANFWWGLADFQHYSLRFILTSACVLQWRLVNCLNWWLGPLLEIDLELWVLNCSKLAISIKTCLFTEHEAHKACFTLLLNSSNSSVEQ